MMISKQELKEESIMWMRKRENLYPNFYYYDISLN